MICDPESQRVRIIEEQRSPLHHSDKKTLNQQHGLARRHIPAAVQYPSPRWRRAVCFWELDTGGKFNEPQPDKPAEDHVA